MKRYGYHRTSTREQHLDRGIKEITAYCEQNNLELEKIFTDQQTGKNFNRPRYQVLKEDVLRAGDKLIITEVDNFTSYKNYNIWLIELKRNISEKVICVTSGVTKLTYYTFIVRNANYSNKKTAMIPRPLPLL